MNSHKKVKAPSPNLENAVYDEMLENITEEECKKEINFIGQEPFKIKTTNAQQIYNFYQIFPQVLV